jgi:hypothetical protein
MNGIARRDRHGGGHDHDGGEEVKGDCLDHLPPPRNGKEDRREAVVEGQLRVTALLDCPSTSLRLVPLPVPGRYKDG